MSERLSLAKALKTGRLADFVAQEETRGVETIDREELDAAINAMGKPGQITGNYELELGHYGDITGTPYLIVPVLP